MLLYYRDRPGPAGAHLHDLGGHPNPAALHRAAMANLGPLLDLCEATSEHPRILAMHTASDDPSSVLYAMQPHHVMMPTSLLTMERWLDRVDHGRSADGMVFSLASRLDLLIHPLAGRGLRQVLPFMAAQTLATFRRKPGGRMSPHLFHRAAGGRISQITHLDAQGTPQIDWDSGEFGAAVARLTEG